MKFHAGFKDIRVKLLDWAGDGLARRVYNFGHLSHDFYDGLPDEYEPGNPNCIKLINKIIDGKTLPKFALEGTRITFQIEGISRICLAQLTRDRAIFASASTGVFPLTQDFVIPLSVYEQEDVMELVEQAQSLLEEAYIKLCEREIPTIEARYIGLHCQTISLCASFTPADFVRSCHSRTSSNFCDECNYVYRLMYKELRRAIGILLDRQSYKLWAWLINDQKCINDGYYERERLYNSDFTVMDYKPSYPALNDWRNSGWKKELERMYYSDEGFITTREEDTIELWHHLEDTGRGLPTTYDNTQPDVAVNMIKTMDYYKEHRK